MRPVVGVVGGGGFGSALAVSAARTGCKVVLWSRVPRTIDHHNVRCTVDIDDLGATELVFVAVPSPHVDDIAVSLGRRLDGRHLVVHVSRGLVGESLDTVAQVLRARTPCRRIGALAGPLVASSLFKGEPGGAIVGSLFPEVADAVRSALGGPSLRIYSTQDLLGVELASALVGLLALAVGYAQGMGLGPGTLAVMATRGVAEAARVGSVRGASPETFLGLAGFGDLIAAVAGDGRPEVAMGAALAEGLLPAAAAERAGAYVEGVSIAQHVAAFAERHALEAPLAAMTARVLTGEVDPQQAVAALMQRPVGRE